MSLPAPAPRGSGSVSRSVSIPGCIFEPEMSVTIFDAQTGSTLTETLTGVKVWISVTLFNPYPGSMNGTVTLETDPRLPDFPATTFVKPGGTGAMQVAYTFANRQVVTGDIDDPGRNQSPSAFAASQNYLIRARMTPLSK